MSNGVGFTVFHVPGTKMVKRPMATRLGGGPVLSNVGSLHNQGESDVGNTPVSSSGTGVSFSFSHRGQRNSNTTFAAFNPPGSLQSLASQTSGVVSLLGAPYAGTSGSMNGHSSTGSNSGLTGSSIGYKSNKGDEPPRGGVGWMKTGRVIRVKDSGDSFRFPLDSEHLPTADLSTDQVETFRNRLIQIAETHVNSTATWLDNPTQSPQYRNESWKSHLDKKNCIIYRQKETEASNLQRKILMRCKIDTSLDELEYAVNCCTTESQRAYMAHCYQDSFLDAAVLQVHEKPSNEDSFQFLGIKWFAFQSSVDSVFSCRDTLVIELLRTMVNTKGQKILVKVQQSVDVADINGSERNFGFIRTSGTCVWLFRSMGPSSGKVDVSMIADEHFDGIRNTPGWLANRAVSTLYTVAINHSTAADAKFLVRGRMITDKAWVPNSARPACSVCFKSFNLLRSRHHCRVCAEIMCSACTVELGIQSSKLPPGMLPETGSSFIVSVEKFCLKCINKARQERRTAVTAGVDFTVDEAHEDNGPSMFAFRTSEVFQGHVSSSRNSVSDRLADKELIPQQNNSLASSSSSTSSLGASSVSGEKSGISYAGWSTKVLSAINREKPADGVKEQSQMTLKSVGSSKNIDVGVRTTWQVSNDRRRHNSDASGGSTSVSSLSDGGSTEITSHKEYIAGDADVLLEEPDEVQNITPLPTSFSKMEEQIAAQQALLRSMLIEGKKIMEQQQALNGQVHPAHQQRYINQMLSSPSRDGKSALALPPSSASIEYID
ncbi:hypothetical protein F443_05634 [Plasmopara halstedii]|uniref:FYVE-type domain-containing protein n=1 Tax=Plasmopara halstedii TaxID=4781 RepID=A0A0P1ADP8_PLAHL|nr:hypothetical protein F443_05634 [Plasmopara halstedii]CEG38726.1 hypothetical protein F443_05634 [Plasmopara halstedii]|eukprot:XP_024575095.1 hypothetical protein F443_05634 [Plasmopara halstedii]